MDLEEERELVRRAKEDPAAFARLYDEHYAKIFNYILRRTGDLEAAKDATADTFFKALRNLWQFRWHGVPFSAWLYRIATNEVNRHYRAGKRTASLDELEAHGFEPADAHTPEDDLREAQEELERHEAFLAYQRAIRELDGKYQDVLSLRFFEHKKFAEIAEILGKPEGTVKSLARRGLALLRRMQLSEHPRIMESKPPVRAKGRSN